MKTNTPIQHTKLGKLIKTIGNYLGFNLKIRGFNRVGIKIIRANGEIENLGFAYNSRVDVGASLQAFLMSGSNFGSLTSPNVPKYIALSTNSLTPAHGDTTLSGETAATGLARAVGTLQNYVAPASLDAAASYDIFHQFTNTSGGSVTIQSSALFDAVSTGNMFVEANLSSSATLANNDILQVTWTVNI